MTLQRWADDTLAEAIGRKHRFDPVTPGSGGPAGNARLTAWTGLVLLVLFLIELVTLLDLNGLLDWHLVVGVLLVPPALLKTATTGWRIVRYYTKQPAYRQAGPPPMLLRVLGPLVVLSTLALLGTGLALIAMGPDASRSTFVTVLAVPLSMVFLHKATFAVWLVVTGVHTLARLVPALRIVGGRIVGGRIGPVVGARTAGDDSSTGDAVPGRMPRAAASVVTLAVAAVAAVVLLGASAAWLHGGLPQHVKDHHRASVTGHDDGP